MVPTSNDHDQCVEVVGYTCNANPVDNSELPMVHSNMTWSCFCYVIVNDVTV